MTKWYAKLLFGGSLLAALSAGLSLFFLMEYLHGWKFGASELVLEWTDTKSYYVLAFMTIVAALSAFPGEADLLKKTLSEKRPPRAKEISDILDTPAPLKGSSWETRPGIREVWYAERCNALVFESLVFQAMKEIMRKASPY